MGWLGRVFLSRKIVFWRSGSFRNTRILDKMGCLEGWGAYFSRKRLVWMAGGTSSEIQEISPEFSFMVLVNNSFLKVVILGNLCGGGFQDPPRRVSREGSSGWQGRVFLEKMACLDG